MLNFLIGLFSFLSGTCLAVAVHLYYKDKIAIMKEDWMEALRTARSEAYKYGYSAGESDEKIVQAAHKQLANNLTVIIPAQKPPKFDDITLLMPKVS